MVGKNKEEWKKISVLNTSLSPDYKVLKSTSLSFHLGTHGAKNRVNVNALFELIYWLKIYSNEVPLYFPTHTPLFDIYSQKFQPEKAAKKPFLNTNFEPTIKIKA